MLKDYGKDRKLVWSIILVIYGVFWGIGYLYRISIEKLSYISVFSLTFVFLFLCMDLYRYHEKWKEINRLTAEHLFLEGMFHTDPDRLESRYRQIFADMLEERHRILDDQEQTMRNMVDYYSLWAHQIKTPIAAMRIVLQSGKAQISSEEEKERFDALSMELFKIEQYVEMVLSYLKIGDMSKDLVLEQYDLGDMVRQAVKKYAKLFILQKTRVSIGKIAETVLTDEKWLVFVLEQILSNALKYAKTGTVRIYMEKKGVLAIEDTGIGIAREDLPRIMERGFTGYNGRKDKKSTGIGLYLCRTILEKLNHQIRIESELGKGTKVLLDLRRPDLEVE